MTTTSREYWDEELETLPWAEVERWQAERIAPAIARIRAGSAMYREMLANLPGEVKVPRFADLARLPFTMKDHVRAAQAAATDEQPLGKNQVALLKSIVQMLSSSGTTGKPLYYGLTARDCEVFSDAIANTWFTAGIRADDVVAHLVGLPMVAGGLPYADGFRRIGATLAWLGGFPTDRILREMRRLRCTALLATTSFGLYLSEQWDAVGQETGIGSHLGKVLCGGEPGLNQREIRDRITGGLRVSQLREVMGLGDVISGMWAECERHEGMHFNAQKYVAIELIDPDTGEVLPWREGGTGEIVYTTFDREATPMVRYRSRDHALVVGVGCSCGRTSPRIRCIGRTDDMLIYKGMNVFPTALRDLIAATFAGKVQPMLRLWKEAKDQVRFDDPIAVDVEAVDNLSADSAETLRKAIETEVRNQLQIRIRVTVLEPKSLPKSVYKNSLVAIREG
jgi:phenylacetate-coenzyme A ligase PaaK-like adenylate-forming protein